MGKMKLIPVLYHGFTAMDRRFSSPMLPWIVSEIRKRESQEKLSLGVEEGQLQAYNADFEVQFSHNVQLMTRFSQADLDPCTFLYLLRDDAEQLLYCYLFQAIKQDDVAELYQQMKDQNLSQNGSTRSLNRQPTLTSLCVNISPSSSNFFEVLYIGKIKVWHKKVPDTFIDDALQKFKQHDIEKNKRKLCRLNSEMDLRRGSIDSVPLKVEPPEVTGSPHKLQRSFSLISNLSIKSPDVDRKIPTCIEKIVEYNEENESTSSDDKREIQQDISDLKNDIKDDQNADGHNRTMVLQVDRTDLRLISPDRKVVLLHKQHKDVTTCIQGISHPEHFGFICHESNNVNIFIGFVFKCESSSVASEAVAAISQAFNNIDSKQPRPNITSCDQCPMVWFHKLCCEIENLTDRKTQAAIYRKIDQLDEEEQNQILTKFRGAETDSLREQNEFLMMLLRAHCEMKQMKHMHDTLENRSEFINQYIAGNTIFKKAKRSLSNSFDHLLKRRLSKDDFGSTIKDMTLPIRSFSRESSPNVESMAEKLRPRSSTLSSIDLKDAANLIKDNHDQNLVPPVQNEVDKNLKSPIMDMFYKVGSNPKGSCNEDLLHNDSGSWRQAIFNRVNVVNNAGGVIKKRDKEELRALWKKAYHQAILLVRMEKENARIRAKVEESAVKRIKLEYDEITKKHEHSEVWDKSLKNTEELHNAIKEGIPRNKRGEVWQYLSDQFSASNLQIDLTKYPNYSVPYEKLLKQLTSHQHAILIDLGRTFPSHSYFASPLGPGQLALFNILKAYSLLDSEVGYCQGLSFVAGLLLLHMEESQAFSLLKHIMYERGLRKQYLPDMVGLQVKLYQLSRLIHDHLPDVYNHLDAYEVAPTLYAAPWLLTIFASQFPLGFVTRIFDLIFLENTDVIFRVILSLLTLHKESILSCDNFEDIMNCLKITLPSIDQENMDLIMKKVCGTDISKQLSEYQIEYYILQEEIQAIQPRIESFNKLENHNKNLIEQNKALISQLEIALAKAQRLEKTRNSQQSTINSLEGQNHSLESSLLTLANYITTLNDVPLSTDVKNILTKLNIEHHNNKSESKNIFNMFKRNEPKIHPNKIMVKSLSMGRIGFDYEKTLALHNALNKIDSVEDIEEEKIINRKEKDTIVSPTNSEDSGLETPSVESDKQIVHEVLVHENLINDLINKDEHPLSNCDINCTYKTRELKKVKSIRDMRNSSPDVVK